MERQDDLIVRLRGEGLIDEAATELAFEEQAVHGGQLSSHLLAMGFLDEPDLVRIQADQFGMEPANYRQGIVLDTGLINLLGPEFVRRHQVVPIATDRLPTLFTCAPIDVSVRQTIESKTGISVRIFWWPELRHLQAMHNALGDRLPSWATGFFKENPVTMTLAGEQITADIQDALRSSRSLGSHWTVEELHDFVNHCFDRDTLLKVLLGYAGNWLSNRMVAVISNVGLQPYFVEDWIDLDPRFEDLKELRKLSISLASTTRALSSQAGFIPGAPGELGLEGLFEAMDATPPVFMVVVPVCIGSRVAMLLAGVPTSRARAVELEQVSESSDMSLLEDAARAVGSQLEELIKRAKSGSLPPRDERIPPLPQQVFESLTVPPEPAEEFDPRQTQRLEKLSAISEASSPQAIVEEHLDPTRTSAGMPALTIDDLSPDDLESASVPIKSEVDDGWDNLLDQAKVSEPVGSRPVAPQSVEHLPPGEPTEDEESFSARPASTRDTLHGGFSVDAEGPEGRRDTPKVSQTMRMSSTPHAETSPAREAPVSEPAVEPEHKQELVPEALPAAADKGVPHDSLSYLPEAQIFKRYTTWKKPLTPISPAEKPAPAGFSARTPSGAVSPQTLALGAVVSHPSSVDRTLRSHEALLEPELDPFSSEAQNAGATFLDVLGRFEPDPALSSHAWLDEWSEEDRKERESKPIDEPIEKMTVNTKQPGLGTKTPSSGPRMQESTRDLPHSQRGHGPLTIPPEAFKERPDTGPVTIKLEQSVSTPDSSDVIMAIVTAEHLAMAGGNALDALESIFPGRLLIDRYQYTPQTLPPVAEHGAVLNALVRIGEPSLKVARKFLDHQSLELRFYATFLLTELPAQNLLDQVYPRLFDRDMQTRYLAQKIVSHQRHVLDFEQKILGRLRQELTDNVEEMRVEVAADILRAHKDVSAVAPLIDALSQHQGRIQARLHDALRQITLQSFSPNISEWRNWWYDAYEEPRTQWLIDALNNADDSIRYLAFDEVQNIPGLELKYHPEQPAKLRLRAQTELRAFFDALS